MFPQILTYIALLSASVSAFNTSPCPSPTLPPHPHELLRRQEAPQRTLLAAPDPTCGYINGQSDSPWGCSTGNCVFATPTAAASENQTAAGSVLCCDPKTGCPAAPAPTACLDNGSMASCTGSCHDDPTTLKCTEGLNLYCASLSFPTPLISAIFCTYISNSNSSALTAGTTYSDQSPRSFTPTVAQFAVSTTSHPPTSASTKHASVTTSSTVPDAATSSSAAAKKESRKKKNTIIGAVVGGVLGGLLVLGAAIWGLTSRKRKNTEIQHETEKAGKERALGAAGSQRFGHAVAVEGGNA